MELALLDNLDDRGNILAGQLEGQTERRGQTGELQTLVNMAPGLEDVRYSIVLITADLLGPVQSHVHLTGRDQHDEASGRVGEREGYHGSGGSGQKEGALAESEESAATCGESVHRREERVAGGGVDHLVGVHGGLQSREGGERSAVTQGVGSRSSLVDDHQEKTGGGQEEQVIAHQVAGEDGVVDDGDQLDILLNAISTMKRLFNTYTAVLSR